MENKILVAQKQGSPDDFQTPKEALDYLIPFLNKEWLIWECACGNGNLVKGFEEKGFKVIGTDIKIDRNIDFIEWSKNCIKDSVNFDCIVTNPPYSLKEKFLETCYELDKPFALLLPLTALESEKRQKLFREFGIQLIIPNKRINFELPNGEMGGGSYFLTAWYCYKMNLPKDLNFVKLE